MNKTLDYLVRKLNIDTNRPSPIRIYYSRNRIIDLFKDLNFTSGVEVGTAYGTYSQKLCLSLPTLKLYTIDPFKTLPYYETYQDQSNVDKIWESARERLKIYNCELLKMTSMEAVKRFTPNSLDFAFIDGDHRFEYVVNDIIYWSKIVKPGGVIYGHDYTDQFNVKQAVDAFMAAHKINPWFILHVGGRMIDCWMYIKEDGSDI